MREIDVLKRSSGVRFNDKGEAEILVWAPSASLVSIIYEERKLALRKEEQGYWSVVTDKLGPGSRYKIMLDGAEYPDPFSLSQPGGVHEASEAVTEEFEWTDSAWQNHRIEDYIFYEVHTGTFTPEGTFEALEQKLDHLVSLGITAIEIMPVAQFPGKRNWGYDGVFPFCVQDSYGGAAGLKKLVDACHNKKLAVVLDVVYNHVGPEGNYLDLFGAFFTDKYRTPWGKAVNYDDAGCDGVRRMVIENALMWFRDFHIDALRLDAVHAINDLSATHILKEIREYTDELMKASGRRHYLVVESDLNDPKYIQPVFQCGYGMHAQWNDEFHHALRVTAGQERNGYYSDFSGIAHLAKAYRDAYVYDGQYSEQRQRSYGLKATARSSSQFVVFSQNHDQVGNRMCGERTCTLLSFEMQKLLAGAVILSPFLPLLFMGEEWGETNPFLYFTDHSDEALSEAVRNGRKNEFSSFHNGEAPDPTIESSFTGSKLQWEQLDKKPGSIMFSYYKKLIALRKELNSIRLCSRQETEIWYSEADKTLSLYYRTYDESVLCLMNFSPEERSVIVPGEGISWIHVLDSSSAEWDGKGGAPGNCLSGMQLAMRPESIMIFKNV